MSSRLSYRATRPNEEDSLFHLSAAHSACVDFQTHLQDVVTILHYLMRQPFRSPAITSHFTPLIIRRVYPQLGAQIALAFNVWGNHPTVLLRRALTSQKMRGLTPSTITLTLTDSSAMSSITAHLKRHHLDACDEGSADHFVTPENAYAWASVIDEVCEPLHNLVQQDSSGGHRPRVKPTLTQPEAFTTILISLEALRILVDSSLIEALCAYVPRGIGYESRQRERQERWSEHFKR